MHWELTALLQMILHLSSNMSAQLPPSRIEEALSLPFPGDWKRDITQFWALNALYPFPGSNGPLLEVGRRYSFDDPAWLINAIDGESWAFVPKDMPQPMMTGPWHIPASIRVPIDPYCQPEGTYRYYILQGRHKSGMRDIVMVSSGPDLIEDITWEVILHHEDDIDRFRFSPDTGRGDILVRLDDVLRMNRDPAPPVKWPLGRIDGNVAFSSSYLWALLVLYSAQDQVSPWIKAEVRRWN